MVISAKPELVMIERVRHDYRVSYWLVYRKWDPHRVEKL